MLHVAPFPSFDGFHTPFIEAASDLPESALEGSISDRFAALTDRFGDKAAVESDSHAFSYAELKTIADRIAFRILVESNDSDALVGLYVDDDALLIAAVFGVLASGKGYLVLDPRYPDERIDLLLRESGTGLVLFRAGRDTAAKRLEDTGARVLQLEALLDGDDGPAPGMSIDPERLALVMYTSGSTGQPHGVAHTHRSILSEARELTRLLRSGHRDKWIQYAPMSFASSIRSTFGALLTGGTLVLYDIGRYGFSRLEETLASGGVTIYRSLPSTFRHFTGMLDGGTRFPGVRLLSLGGETITPTDLERFNRHFETHCVLMTSFGPTECLGACWGFVSHGAKAEGPRVPMGYARPGKQVSIVDEHGRTVPDNVIGEIAVTGRHLSNGYWRDEESTRRRFLQKPDGTWTFLTGDLGVCDGGVFTHMGRRDGQAKIRGYRVDIVEIEDHLRRVDGIDDAVVLVRPNEHGETRLVAYVLETNGKGAAAADAREKLRARLPHYMVPEAVEAVHAFPFNSNGKIDRDALPEPGQPVRGSDPSNVEETDAQRQIASVWARVLKVETVNLDESFADLGGDSLNAAQVSSYLSRRFGVELSINRILDAASVRDLEQAICSQKSAGSS